MAILDLAALIGRLDELCRRQFEAAAGLTLTRTHYNVEPEHILLKLIEAPRSDITLILQRAGADLGRIAAELQHSLDRLRHGNARAPSLSPSVIAWLREAWLAASLMGKATQIRSAHLLVALLGDEALSRAIRDSAPSLIALRLDLSGDAEQLAPGSEEAPSHPDLAAVPAAGGENTADALARFCTDLTAQARAGRIDPILGRDAEIRQVVDILTRRRQNNPLLAGEPGVGKTAIAEGLALRIAQGEVPEALRPVRLLALDLGMLQAGAGVKGEFEGRLRDVIEAVKGAPQPVILFVDEAHTLIGAGGQAGQSDAANLLKPALARGELRCLAATTWAEYKKYFEKDAALARRFQVVKVEEPAQPMAAAMLRALVPTLEAHHKVRILDEAVVDAVRLSARYLPARQLPDKAVSLLDTACARVAMSQAAAPPAIEDRRRQRAIIDAEAAAGQRDGLEGVATSPRLDALKVERGQLEDQLACLEQRWQQEQQLVADIAALRGQGDAAIENAGARAALLDTLSALRQLQGEAPLVHATVDAAAIAAVLQGWTGIPLGRMLGDETAAVLDLQARLQERIIGQPQALEAIARAVRTSRAGLADPRKPLGVFLMVGTSGVGKTETALALADLLYGGEQNLTIINMNEFKEEHRVSLLMGSAPGYVGHGEGGVMTEAVRRRPYSVLLLDEMEKAHPGVQDVFYQVFDKGRMTDGDGREIDFRNTLIIMTSNAASDTIAKLCADPDLVPEPEALQGAIQPVLLQSFRPAFLGRCEVIAYRPLVDADMRRIVDLALGRVAARMHSAYGVALQIDPDVPATIVAQCRDAGSGARGIEGVISRLLLPELSARILARLAAGQAISAARIQATMPAGGFTFAVE
jgi:type VI secretion system protein VasG